MDCARRNSKRKTASETRRKTRLKIYSSDEDDEDDSQLKSSSNEENMQTTTESESCGSSFCAHYIALIEEKAKNYKLKRQLEDQENRILDLEEIIDPQSDLISSKNIEEEENTCDYEDEFVNSSLMQGDEDEYASGVSAQSEDNDNSNLIVNPDDSSDGEFCGGNASNINKVSNTIMSDSSSDEERTESQNTYFPIIISCDDENVDTQSACESPTVVSCDEDDIKLTNACESSSISNDNEENAEEVNQQKSVLDECINYDFPNDIGESQSNALIHESDQIKTS